MKSLLVRLSIYLAFAVSAVAALIVFRHARLGVLALVIFTYLSVLMFVLAIMLNYPRQPRQAMVNAFADELEKQNLLLCTNFRADRAFRVGGGDEGPHYFLELEGGSILHLCGDYLCDYEPVAGAIRHFPCTEFTVRRHAEVGYAIDLICGGIVIEPEVEAPAYPAHKSAPEDGAILHDVSFDQLRHQLTNPNASMQ